MEDLAIEVKMLNKTIINQEGIRLRKKLFINYLKSKANREFDIFGYSEKLFNHTN